MCKMFALRALTVTSPALAGGAEGKKQKGNVKKEGNRKKMHPNDRKPPESYQNHLKTV